MQEMDQLQLDAKDQVASIQHQLDIERQRLQHALAEQESSAGAAQSELEQQVKQLQETLAEATASKQVRPTSGVQLLLMHASRRGVV